MVFSSLTFIFIFLPVFLFFYYLFFSVYRLAKKNIALSCANLLLFLASLVFYFWGQGWFVILMMVSAILDYACGLGIDSARNNPRFSPLVSQRLAKASLIASIVGNLTILGIFKYFNFGVDLFQSLNIHIFGIEKTFIHIPQIILPLGISFYTFQTMSYTIDVYRGVVKANKNFIDYACFVTMFPQLVAGPIVRYKDVADQLVNRVVAIRSFSSGVERFCIGLGKKVCIANTMAIVADKVFAIPVSSLSIFAAWLGVIVFAIQIYYDFSGYSDMAIGLGRMLGFEFQENFNYPYIAQSIADYWRRWHISLSTWFRDYLYMPLRFKRLGQARTHLNLIFVFFLIGLWHGAAVKFIGIGLYHGFFMVLERGHFGKFLNALWRPARHLYTIFVIMVSLVFFRADSMAHSLAFLKVMFGFGDKTARFFPDPAYVNKFILLTILAGIIGCMPIGQKIKKLYTRFIEDANFSYANPVKAIMSFMSGLCLTAIFVASTMFLASGTYKPFIYFRF